MFDKFVKQLLANQFCANGNIMRDHRQRYEEEQQQFDEVQGTSQFCHKYCTAPASTSLKFRTGTKNADSKANRGSACDLHSKLCPRDT